MIKIPLSKLNKNEEYDELKAELEKIKGQKVEL